jgi:DNA polymerase-3 subunit delta
VHVVSGADSWLAEQAVEAILTKAVGRERGDDTVEVLRGDEVGWGRVVDAARTGSLFAAARVVLVRNADAIKGEGEDLVAYLEQPSPATTLVLVVAKADKRRQPWKRVFDRATVSAAEPLRGAQLKGTIADLVRKRKLALSGDGLEELVARVGQDLRRLVAELDKLEAYAAGGTRSLAAEDVAALLGRGMGQPLYKLSDAVGARRVAEALALLEEALDDGAPGLVVLATLHNGLRQLRAYKALAQARVPRDAMMESLGLRANMAFKLDILQRLARGWSDEELAAAVKALELADWRVKAVKGGMDQRTALTAAVVEACGAAASPGRGSAPVRTATRTSGR